MRQGRRGGVQTAPEKQTMLRWQMTTMLPMRLVPHTQEECRV